MAVVPTPPDWSGGGVVTTTQLNQLALAVNFVLNPPRFRGRQTAAQTLTSSVWGSILIDTDDVDRDPTGAGGHSTSTNTSNFVPVYAGWYLLPSSGTGFSSMATPAGRRGSRWVVNGTAVRGAGQIFSTSSTTAGAVNSRGILVFLAVGDILELQGFFEGGGTLLTNVGDHNESSFDVVWVSNP